MDTDFRNYTRNVSAYIQILPSIEQCWEDIKILDDNKTIYIRSNQDFGRGKVIIKPNYWSFVTDGILYGLSQDIIFKRVIKESLHKVINGVDLILFSYGQTGSGKSFTINGLHNNYNNRGIGPRIISELFNLQNEFIADYILKFSVSYVEINRLYIKDLLHPQNTHVCPKTHKTIKIVRIFSEEEGLKYLFEGESQRKIWKNNHVSNLLTSVFTIYVRNISRVLSQPVEKHSKIHIIDMAGIDYDGKESCYWKNTKQIGTGNLNKTQLEQCMLTIQKDAKNNKKTIRDNGILVEFLGNSLSCNNMIKFIGHIYSTRKYLSISLSTLRFANIVKSTKSARLIPFIVPSEKLLRKNLEKELDKLRNHIYMDSMLMNNDLQYNISSERRKQMENAITEFLQDKTKTLTMLNVVDIEMTVNIFKNMCNKLIDELEEINKKDKEAELELKTESIRSIRSSLKLKISPVTPVVEVKQSKYTKNSKVTMHKKHRKSGEKSFSRMSRHSTHSTKRSSSIETTPPKTYTYAQLMSHDFEGDVTKSLKLKSQLLKKPSVDLIREELVTVDNLAEKGKELDISQFEQTEDFEDNWNLYKADSNYNYEILNTNLTNIEESTKELLKKFNSTRELLQTKAQSIDIKKQEMYKIEIFKQSGFHCASNDVIKMTEVIETLAGEVVEIMNETIGIKEELLKLQAEIKTNINEYHRVKRNIANDFSQFCMETFRISITPNEQISVCIEDKLNKIEPIKEEIEIDSEQEKRDLFTHYQEKMKYEQNKQLEELEKAKPRFKI